jgi:hypothetical protein
MAAKRPDEGTKREDASGWRSAAPDSPARRRFRRWLLAQLFFLCLALLAFLLSVALRDNPAAIALLRGANIGFGIAAVICGVRRLRSRRCDPPSR